MTFKVKRFGETSGKKGGSGIQIGKVPTNVAVGSSCRSSHFAPEGG
jgi:hypothetical protein